MIPSPACAHGRLDDDRLLPLCIGLGTLLLAAHSSGAIATFPAISRQIGTSVAAGQWILTTYTLALSACLLTFGVIADRIGLKRVCIYGLLVFAAGSAICALATRPGTLALLRAVQAAGAAMVSATTVALIGRDVPEHRRGQALGWQTSMTYAGLALGPVTAAYVVDRAGWRALFLLNIPAALLAALALRRFAHGRDQTAIAATAHSQRSSLWMLVQTIAWTATLVAALLAIAQSERRGWFSGAAVVCAAAFIAANRRGRTQLLPWSAFRGTAFRSAVANEVIFYACVYAAGFLLPLYLMRQRGLTTVAAGVYIGAQSAARALAAALSGRVADRVASRLVVAAAALVLCGALYWTTAFGLDTAWWQISAAMMLLGAGTGVFVPANSRALLDAAASRRYGVSSGILATARNIGMTLGVALAAAAYSTSSGSGAGASAMPAMHQSFAILAAVALLFAAMQVLQFRPLRPHQAIAKWL